MLWSFEFSAVPLATTWLYTFRCSIVRLGQCSSANARICVRSNICMFESQVFGVEMNNGWQSDHVVCASVMLKAEVDFFESGIVCNEDKYTIALQRESATAQKGNTHVDLVVTRLRLLDELESSLPFLSQLQLVSEAILPVEVGVDVSWTKTEERARINTTYALTQHEQRKLKRKIYLLCVSSHTNNERTGTKKHTNMHSRYTLLHT